MQTLNSLFFVIVLLSLTSFSISSKANSNLKTSLNFNVPLGGSCDNKKRFCKISWTKLVVCNKGICSNDLIENGESCKNSFECISKRCENKVCSGVTIADGQSGLGEFCRKRSQCKSGLYCDTYGEKCQKERKLNESCTAHSQCECPYPCEATGLYTRKCQNINTFLRDRDCKK